MRKLPFAPVRKIEWHGRIILVINSRSSTDEHSGSLDHTRWSARIHAHRCILTRESSSRIWRETMFNRSSIVLSICRLVKGPWYTRKSTFLSSNSSFVDRLTGLTKTPRSSRSRRTCTILIICKYQFVDFYLPLVKLAKLETKARSEVPFLKDIHCTWILSVLHFGRNMGERNVRRLY